GNGLGAGGEMTRSIAPRDALRQDEPHRWKPGPPGAEPAGERRRAEPWPGHVRKAAFGEIAKESAERPALAPLLFAPGGDPHALFGVRPAEIGLRARERRVLVDPGMGTGCPDQRHRRSPRLPGLGAPAIPHLFQNILKPLMQQI